MQGNQSGIAFALKKKKKKSSEVLWQGPGPGGRSWSPRVQGREVRGIITCGLVKWVYLCVCPRSTSCEVFRPFQTMGRAAAGAF